MKSLSYKRIQLLFAVAAVLLLLLSLFSYLRIGELGKTADRVNHTTLVKLELNKIYISTYEADADSRGFILTKDPVYLTRMDRNVFVLNGQMANLKNLVGDNYSQLLNYRKLDSLVRLRTEYMRAITVDGVKHKISSVRWLRGRQIMNQLKSQIVHMVAEEEMQYKIRNVTFSEASLLTPMFTIFLTCLSLLILVASYLLLSRELKTSNKLQNDLLSSETHLRETNEILVSRNASLDTMNKELESFTYISSHDLQEPLRKIQTFLSRIGADTGDVLSEKSLNYLERSQMAARRMQNLIQDLLAYSRVSKEVFSFEPVVFGEMCLEIKEELSEEIENSGGRVEVIGSGMIYVIRVQFRQLLINLVANALKFKIEGKAPKVKIMLEQVLDPTVNGLRLSGRFDKISVSDNGIGIEPQYQQRIFEVFQRLHSREEYSGTGVGLAIVKKIVENHQGYMEIVSTLGKGATFSIYLPESIG